MNWFTQSHIAHLSAKRKLALSMEDSCCEHVEADPSCAVTVRREMDSFGPVSSYVVCTACDDKACEEEDNREYTCYDCGKEFPLKGGTLYKWWGFYAPQGDEELPVCNHCRIQPKHLARLKRDREEEEADRDQYGF